MTSSNRVLNRIVIVIAAIVLIAGGVAAALIGWGADRRPEWADHVVTFGANAIGTVLVPNVDVLEYGVVPLTVLIAVPAAVLLVVLLLVYVGRRGRGSTATVYRAADSAGTTSVDQNIAQAVLAEPLNHRPDVTSARTRVFNVKGAAAIDFAVTARRGAHLDEVLAAADERVSFWDELIDTATPVVVRITGPRLSDRMKSTTRVQ